MQTPSIPENEAERLSALYKLSILDSAPEERFDRVTRVAASVFHVPVAYVAFIDAERQWLKSRCGAIFKESSRDVSFCGHTILRDDAMIVPDTLEDPRFSDNPLVTDAPHVRFYAGHPLSTADGQKVGTLCIVDYSPRRMAEAEVTMLGEMAAMVEDQLSLVDVVHLQQELLQSKKAYEQACRDLEVRNRFIRDVFGRYMTDEVADRVLEAPDALQIGGESRTVTVLMSDIRGFTPLSERLAPTDVVDILNRELGVMVDVIMKHGGTIDNLIGDAILVLFGAPIARDDDTQRAVACAIDMQLAVEQVNRESRRRGLPEIQLGIGITTGEVVVGNIGSERRCKYSAIGGPVNLAERIESLTLGGQILISERTLREVRDLVRVDGHLRVKIKGVEGPVSIYDVGGIGGRFDLQLPPRDDRACVVEVLR